MLLILFYLLAAVSITASGQNVTIQTDKGAVQGFINGNVQTFRGIPFAASPVGELRLKAPQPHASWNTTWNATQNKPMCPQIRVIDGLYLGQEDCLYLDVYAPIQNDHSQLLPVMVWFYGGGFSFGDENSFGLYDGTNLVNNHHYVFVTPNYRVGPLGFLALDELKAEDANNSTGNYGTQDQVRALQWVRDNARAFGGDPNRVTIVGESAGAFSVCWHLANEQSKGLFHAAIMESGTCEAPQFFVSYERSTGWSKDYITAMGCDATNNTGLLSCIRGLTTDVIIGGVFGQQNLYTSSHCPQLYPIMPWGPTIDGSSAGLKDVPLDLMKKGQWNKVNLIWGTNKDEGSIFVPMMTLIIPGVQYPLQLNQVDIVLGHFFNRNKTIVGQILEEYPVSEYASLDDLASEILRDYFFVCSARRTLKVLSLQGVNTYLYHFTYKGDWVEDPSFGDYHSAELEYVMDNAWPPLIHIFSTRDQAMSDVFTQFWSNMAHTHDPNGNGTQPVPAKWPIYEPTSLLNIVLDDPPVVQMDLLEGKCEFWDRIVAEPW